MDNSYQYVQEFKTIIVGSTAVGKSELAQTIGGASAEGRSQYEPTIGIEFASTRVELPSKETVKFNCFECSGTERKQDMLSPEYYKVAHNVILVIDLSNEKSVNSTNKFLENVKKYCPKATILVTCNVYSDKKKAIITDFEINARLQQEAKELNLTILPASGTPLCFTSLNLRTDADKVKTLFQQAALSNLSPMSESSPKELQACADDTIQDILLKVGAKHAMLKYGDGFFSRSNAIDSMKEFEASKKSSDDDDKLKALILHSTKGGTFGFGNNRTFEAMQKLGYLNSNGQPTSTSNVFSDAWHKAFGITPENNTSSINIGYSSSSHSD